MTFGKWLAAKREAVGMTQPQLAKRAGISVSYVSALERDEPNAKDGSPRRPRIEKVDKIAKALGVLIDDAREAAGYAPLDPKPKTAKEALQAIEKLIPGFDGVLWFEQMTDEDAERMLDAFKAIARLHK
jgi:transcriptional regulator with XRE-family HTH domain